MRKLFAVIALVLVFISMLSVTASAAAAHETWNDVVDEMESILDESYDTYTAGEAKAAKEQVDVAYYSYYEKLGFEKTVMAHISGNRAATVEYQFSAAKKAINAGKPKEEVRASLDELIKLLREDADQLDGKKESAVGVFLSALLIITREGFEAIIVVGAIIAYLVKSGNKDKTRAVYWGALIALGASVVMAFILNSLSGASGANQEITEGLTMLVAVAVLFYVSNWMVSKSEAAAWTSYIEGKVQSSVTKGSVFSLAFAAFLAVFREGAETILFYQALLDGTKTYFNMVWLGLGIGCVALVVIYLLIRFMSIKLPLKPFFLGTSILLFVMSITFVGSGVKELQEGNLVGVTPIPGISSVDILGIYPTLETLLPQVLLLALTVLTFVLQIRKMRKVRALKASSADGPAVLEQKEDKSR
ncbi:high-affinity iron transporter [Sporobacter termitidis DSM 10068]|uniref:High-affinity iron transporter n=1 Tax=Sporobacter termitidis DSM 10068 TaxID=1123282 RepID=A0A1M5XVF8_9FIRM|nr:FTR1 family protein [Sporobacter termitidis]SHI03243.1 high-affinity iron transporter [Sporobacter termitidis DSM 10068]